MRGSHFRFVFSNSNDFYATSDCWSLYVVGKLLTSVDRLMI